MPIKKPQPRNVAFTLDPTLATVRTLAIPQVVQWGNNWCWAACAEMVFRFYQRARTQCDLVNQLFGLAEDCCAGDPDALPSEPCDQPCDPDDVITLYELDTNGLTAVLEETDHLDFAVLRTEIAAGRPVEVELVQGTGQHVVLVTSAWKRADGTEMVDYNDPWFVRADTDDTFAHLDGVFAGRWWREIGEQ